jgi:hypothetical protein
MTHRAKRNQILLGIVPGVAAKLFVVDPQIDHGAARLAPPSIPSQYVLAEPFVRLGVKPQSMLLRLEHGHDACLVARCKKVCLSSGGRNLKKRMAQCKRTSGFSFSRFAPARKSAQIISKQ